MTKDQTTAQSLPRLLVTRLLMADVEAESLSPEQKLRKLVLAFVHLILDDLHGTALTLDGNNQPVRSSIADGQHPVVYAAGLEAKVPLGGTWNFVERVIILP